LSQYATQFTRQGYVSLQSALELSWEDLEDLGITKLGKNKNKGQNIALKERTPHREDYGVSLVIWDHTVLPATRQR